MTGPDKRSPKQTGTQADDAGGYPEPQPHDADDARHRGPDPGKDREDGGLARDADGGDDDPGH